MPDTKTNELRSAFRSIAADADAYFTSAASVAAKPEESPFSWSYHSSPDHYWSQVTPELQEAASDLTSRLLTACASLADIARSSLLTGSEDLRDVKIAAKTMRAALRLRKYHYREPEVLHDDGNVLGYRPGEQSETSGLSPVEAQTVFSGSTQPIAAVLKLVEVVGNSSEDAHIPQSEGTKYRAGTAFIMMWMDPKHPELTDVADTVRGVFSSFGIRAVRADDIEHEGLITERVLNEIRTCEFLFADLTGTRPNVYYEVGFAHALGKRVILFRHSGTGIHFDLAGYNCPEYENLRDLRDKLTKRLVILTNRNPASGEEI